MLQMSTLPLHKIMPIVIQKPRISRKIILIGEKGGGFDEKRTHYRVYINVGCISMYSLQFHHLTVGSQKFNTLHVVGCRAREYTSGSNLLIADLPQPMSMYFR